MTTRRRHTTADALQIGDYLPGLRGTVIGVEPGWFTMTCVVLEHNTRSVTHVMPASQPLVVERPDSEALD
jgi:hypothetical protein